MISVSSSRENYLPLLLLCLWAHSQSDSFKQHVWLTIPRTSLWVQCRPPWRAHHCERSRLLYHPHSLTAKVQDGHSSLHFCRQDSLRVYPSGPAPWGPLHVWGSWALLQVSLFNNNAGLKTPLQGFLGGHHAHLTQERSLVGNPAETIGALCLPDSGRNTRPPPSKWPYLNTPLNPWSFEHEYP